MELENAIYILNLELSESQYKKTNNVFYTAIERVLNELQELKKVNKSEEIEKITNDMDEHYFYHTFI